MIPTHSQHDLSVRQHGVWWRATAILMNVFVHCGWVCLIVIPSACGDARGQAPEELLNALKLSESTKVVRIEFENPFDKSQGSGLLEVPAKMNAPTPLIVSPHGAGWSAETNRPIWRGIADQLGVMILHPTHQGQVVPAVSLGGSRQMANLDAAITYVTEHYNVDPRRIYAAGLSQGATESLLLAGQNPERFAGALAVNPVVDFVTFYEDVPGLRDQLDADFGGPPGQAAEEYARRSPVAYASQLASLPVIIYWADNDQLIPNGDTRQSGRLSALIKAQSPAAFTEVRHSQGHGYPFFRWSKTTKQLEVCEQKIFLASVRALLRHARPD